MVELQKLPSGRIVEVPVSDRTGFYEGLAFDKQRELFDEIVGRAKQYGGIEKITPFLKFNRERGLIGSNLGVKILASESLGEEARFPTVAESMALHEAGMLDNRFVFDEGAVFYSSRGPNSEKVKQIAEKLQGVKTPVILHPADLRLGQSGNTYELSTIHIRT